MKQKLVILGLCICLASCAQKPDLSNIQQTVFGNLPIGAKGKDYTRKFDSIANTSMSNTTGSHYPFFKLINRGLLDTRLTFLYPHAFHNKDSVVTRIVFYLYQVKFLSMEVVESPTTSQQEREILTKIAEESQNKLNFLVEEFNTRSKIDSQYLLNLPNVAQGRNYTELEKEIGSHLDQKYGKTSTTKSIGNEYDKYDFSFFSEKLWKTDKLDIKLVRKRYPVYLNEPSDEFYLILIYEFNQETRAKYKLNKETKLSDTF